MDIKKVIDISGAIDKAMEKEIKVFPCRSNRASQVGHPCLRFLTHLRKDWKEMRKPSLDLQYIFEGGRKDEKSVLELLDKAGLEVTIQQRSFEDKGTQITGHIDGLLEGKYPLEIKGMSMWGWDDVNSMRDMVNSDRTWVQGYPSQIQMYLYLAEQEIGVMCLYNKQTRKVKDIWVKLDYDYCENILRKAETINSYLDTDDYPERMPFDPDTCLSCSFAHLCKPEIAFSNNIEVSDNEELKNMLKERRNLEPLRKDYEKLDTKIKDIIKSMSKDNIIIGDWVITRKVITGVRKPSPGGEYTQTRVTIKEIVGGTTI